VMLAVSYYLIRWRYLRNLRLNADLAYCRKAYQELGPMKYEEKMLTAVFGLTVLLWFFSRDVSFGSFTIKSWANLLYDLPIPLMREPGFVRESTVAMLAALLLFVIPSRQEPGRALLVWREARKMPIGVLFLFGGGFVLAKAVGDSGLSTWLAEHMQLVAFLPPWVVIALACLFMTFFTELTSNTASVVLLLPILQAMALNMDLPPVALLLPVTFSASFAFMLPVATPPNAIVFGSEQLRVQEMVRTGIWLNLVGVAVMLLAVFTLGRWVFGM
ncbi:MAG: SLC13 family permease, partial [Bacteroidota bacterium]